MSGYTSESVEYKCMHKNVFVTRQGVFKNEHRKKSVFVVPVVTWPVRASKRQAQYNDLHCPLS